MTQRGGKRSGAGRPTGSTKPDSRGVRLTQRYNDTEIATITHNAAECGYDSINEYIRDYAVKGAMACK